MPQSPAAPTPTGSAFAPEQLVRLQYEWRRVQRSYAFHPIVRIVPLEGDPPTTYQVEYRIRTLEVDAAGQLGYAPTCSVEMTLPIDFPHSPPLVKPLQAIFHPNVDSESVQIVPPWNPSNTLGDVVERVGRLLAFQSYDPHNVWNPVALEWVATNAVYLPTDPSANLAPDAGGDPLERICRSGPATLPSLREQVRKFIDSLLDPIKPPIPSDVRYFARRTHLAAGLFLDNDIPEALSSQASELDEWAAALPAAEASAAALRKVGAASQSAGTTSAMLAETAKQLNQQLHGSQPMAGNDLPSDPLELPGRLPATAELQKAHGLLRGSLAKAEQKLAAAKAELQSLATPMPAAKLPEPLQTLINGEITYRAAGLREARGQLETTLTAAEPILVRARREAAALDRLVQWREYADTRERVQLLTRQVLGWGAAGVQAYFLSNETGDHGPFDFEQQVDLGTAQIIVRRAGQQGMEAIDLNKGVALGRCESGDLPAPVPGPQPGETFPTTFRATPRCDDLALQFDYAVNQTRSLLQRLAAPQMEEAGISSCAKLAAALAIPKAIMAIQAEHKTLAATWASLASDLRALGPFKARLATYYLLLRVQEALPRYLQERAGVSTAQTKAAARIAAILQRGTKDVESGRTIIPNKLHKEYEALLDESDRLQRDKSRLASAIKNAAAHVKTRMAVKKGAVSTIGSAKLPRLATLPEMPVDMRELSAAMSDPVIIQQVTRIEALVNTKLYFGRRPAPPTAAATSAVPPAPTTEAPAEVDPIAIQAEESHGESSQDQDADHILGDWPA